MTLRFYLFLFLILLTPAAITAQPVYSINDSVGQHIFTFQGIEYLEDPTAKLTLADILAHHQSEFTFSTTNFNPENVNPTSAYWHRIRIQHNKASKKHWVLEFFDQTIDKIDLYVPDGRGS
ncbi:MAG: chromosome partitioning protein ParA, partial [Cyclobacteriaceae bacterium]|nr:chromosome partitioning protein ParA [Cyclobacteriaceae bacterium]